MKTTNQTTTAIANDVQPSARPRLRSAVRAGEMGAVSQATYSQSSERTTGGRDGSFARMGSDFANSTY